MRAEKRPYCQRMSGCFLGALSQCVAEAKGFCLLGGEDEGHFRCALAVFTAHRDLGPAARVNLDLVFRYGFGGAAVWAAEALLLCEPHRVAFLFV